MTYNCSHCGREANQLYLPVDDNGDAAHKPLCKRCIHKWECGWVP